MKSRLLLWLVAAVLMAGLVASPVFAQATGSKTAAPQAAKKPATPVETKAATEAKAKPVAKAAVEAQKPPQPGMVWVNTQSKVYHKEGDRYYGKTKNGKWMTEDEAKKAGFKEAAAGAVKAATKKTAKKATP